MMPPGRDFAAQARPSRVRRSGRLFVYVLILPLAFPPGIARGQDASGTPSAVAATPDDVAQFIKELAAQTPNNISGKRLGDAETRDRFRTLLGRAFDLKTTGRFVLGRYYNLATEVQRQAYQQAFENMIVDAYALRFRDYTGGSLKIGKTVTGGNETEVSSQILQSNESAPINVGWRVRQEAAGLKVVDIMVEGISMSVTERSELSAVLDRNGGNVQALIDTMNNHHLGITDQSKK